MIVLDTPETLDDVSDAGASTVVDGLSVGACIGTVTVDSLKELVAVMVDNQVRLGTITESLDVEPLQLADDAGGAAIDLLMIGQRIIEVVSLDETIDERAE